MDKQSIETLFNITTSLPTDTWHANFPSTIDYAHYMLIYLYDIKSFLLTMNHQSKSFDLYSTGGHHLESLFSCINGQYFVNSNLLLSKFVSSASLQ